MSMQLESENFGYVLIGISLISVAIYAALHIYNSNKPDKKTELEKRMFSRLNDAAEEIEQNQRKSDQ